MKAESFWFHRPDWGEEVIDLLSIGKVHEVEGDGNCGFYCLLVALAEHRRDLQDRPKDQISLRKLLQRQMREMPHLDRLALGKTLTPMFDDESIIEEFLETQKNLYRKDYALKYRTYKFMAKKDKTGAFMNDRHWMDATYGLPIFAKHYGMRVVLYRQSGGVWETHDYDARATEKHVTDGGGITVKHDDGVKVVTGGSRTFGLHFDGEHYQYIELYQAV